MKKNSFSIHNLQCSLNQERSNFQSPLITATKENKKIFDCKIVNNNFSDCNWIRTHNHLVHKRTLNHLTQPAWLNG